MASSANSVSDLERAEHLATGDSTGLKRVSPYVDNNSGGLQTQRILPILESNGAMPVNIQDQHSDILDVFMIHPISTVTLAQTYVLDTKTVILSPGHGVVAGTYLVFKESTKFSQAYVINVATNTITLDRPLDYAFTAAANVVNGTEKMNVDGSVTPVVYRITSQNLGVTLDVTRIIFQIEDNAAMDTATFGGLPALTNGIVIRKKDGNYNTIFNAKTNGDLIVHCDSSQFDTKAPSGSYGFTAIRKFAGQAETGVTVRLNNTLEEEIELVVQDNLTGLTNFRVVVQGHVVTN